MRTLTAALATTAFLLMGGCSNASYDDIGAAQYNICCGGTDCCCTSLGTGGSIGRGDRNPANPCEECDPSVSQSSWTPVADCDAGSGDVDSGPGDTDAGGGTDSGPAGTDAGPSGTDSGPSGTDSGPSGTDSGPGGTDAGPGTEDDGGCDVSATAPGGASGFGLLALMGVVLAARRRRR